MNAEIVGEVKRIDRSIPFRPSLNDLGAEEYIKSCMEACWHEEPEQRPDIRYVRVRLKQMQVKKSVLLMLSFRSYIEAQN